jgi:hypothetical protein
MQTAKPCFTSKTILANLAVIVITYCVSQAEVGAYPAEFLPYAPAFVALGNIGLRFLTSQPVTLV